MSTAAVLVTHNSAKWIAETLVSVCSQDTPVDRIVIVDDHSSDSTLSIIREHGFGPPIELVTSTSTATDVHTRIASNVVQAVQSSGAEFVFLGDHDDLWRRDRVTHQLQTLKASPSAGLIASDGCVFEEGVGATDKTLRDVFPVPAEFGGWRASKQFGYVVRHSVATGGACAIRPTAFHQLVVPAGWLHDRWWSLWAAAHSTLVIDPTIVIDYRVSESQQVGLATAAQGASAPTWFLHHASQALRSARRAIDLAPLFLASR